MEPRKVQSTLKEEKKGKVSTERMEAMRLKKAGKLFEVGETMHSFFE